MSEATKRAVGRAAAELVGDGMRLGLGTGSTVEHLLVALAERDPDVVAVPTSEATATRCRELGIALTTPDEVARLDLAIDGADELDGELTATKGGGGALLREKVVASMADRFVLIAARSKLVDRLADSFPLPVEVVPFAAAPVSRELQRLGFEVARRRDDAGQPVVTDNGNAILDARFPGGLADPAVTDIQVSVLPGVACSGLFVDLAEQALLGDGDHVEVVTRPTPGPDSQSPTA